MLHQQGDHAAAEVILRRTLKTHRDQSGAPHVPAARVRQALADGLAARGDLAAAEQLYAEALATFRDRLGETHARTRGARAALEDLRDAGQKASRPDRG